VKNPSPHHLLRRLAAIALCACIAGLAAFASVNTVRAGLPPTIVPRDLEVAGASAQILVDQPRSVISDRLATDDQFQALQARGELLANLLASADGRAHLGRRAGVPAAQIAARARVTRDVPKTLVEPNSERRAADIADARASYRLEVLPSQTQPGLSIFTQAPTVAEAQRLADAGAPALRDLVADLDRQDDSQPGTELHLEQLGSARGAPIGGAKRPIAALTFVAVFAGMLVLPATTRRLRRAGMAARRSTWMPSQDDTWPRTTRILPWMVAGMMAVVWLVPFNVIALTADLPIDLRLDRLLLPFLFGAWALALVAGGPGAPRVRPTWMHAAAGVLIALACLSLILNATDLTHTLELETSLKKLTLLIAFITLFVIVASVVRREEVPRFMTFTLVLAVLCALGTIWEYRFEYNIFYSMADKVLPSIFEVGAAESSAVDQTGRRMVRGPAEVSLEVVAMLAMALPISLVGVMQASHRRERMLYILAAGVLLAAIVSTYRKSAFVAPIAVVLTLAYFRRQELLRLAPLGAAVLVMVYVLAPGAFGAVAVQWGGDRLGDVATVSDRSSDYDAIRPDVWTHLAFGRGYGSYESSTYRILDMELLRQLIEVGVIGLVAYLGLTATVVAVAGGPIRRRGTWEAPVALAVAAAAVAFLVVSLLFDVMSFPHVPYIFLFLSAMLAAIVSEPSAGAREVAWSS
jgi:hypothetical protein